MDLKTAVLFVLDNAMNEHDPVPAWAVRLLRSAVGSETPEWMTHAGPYGSGESVGH